MGLFLPIILSAQETIINVSISQPKKLTVETGGDLLMSPGDSVYIGESITVSGGTPEYSYAWEDPEGSIFSTASFWADILGQYKLTVTDSRNCSASDQVLVLTTSIDNEISDPWFRIYPNPSDGHFQLEIKRSAPEKDLNIFNAGGSLLKTIPAQEAVAGTVIELDLSAYGPGLYFLHFPVDGKAFVKPLLIR